MKILIVVIALLSIASNSSESVAHQPAMQFETRTFKSGKRILVDSIDVVVHGAERSEIICKSDQARRGIDSRTKNLDTLINEELVFGDAIKAKVPIENSVVKEHLQRTIRGFGFKPGDEVSIFAQEGYSYEEGFELFKKMYAQQTIVDHRVKTGLMVTEDEVLAYYNAHPIVKEPCYFLQTAFVPCEQEKGKKIKGLEKDVERYIKTGKGLDITWSDASPLQESDIADAVMFITKMDIDQIQQQTVHNGIQLYKLKNKKPQRVVSLKKRYREIADYLIRPKFEERLTKYYKTLRDGATIIYL